MMEYLEKMRSIRDRILEFIDAEDNDYNEHYQKNDDIKPFILSHAKLDKYKLKSVLHLISKISQNHHRDINFLAKIKQIISIFQKEIKQTMSNQELYYIFKKNKIILLHLIEEKIITIDQEIIELMAQNEDQNFKKYFKPEIEQNYEEKDMPESFKEKRRKGENDSYICELIREDNVVEFIVLYNKNEISLNMKVPTSIYETNSFLMKKEPTLIEYSAFFGSIEIFNYLRMNGVDLTPSLWLYAIHSKNPEIIHLLEENHVECDDQIYCDCYRETIKCHHQDFEMYYKNNFFKETFNDYSKYFENEISYGFHYYNFNLIPNETTNKLCFYYSVDYDYYKFVEYYYKNITGMNINELIIFFIIFY